MKRKLGNMIEKEEVFILINNKKKFTNDVMRFTSF